MKPGRRRLPQRRDTSGVCWRNSIRIDLSGVMQSSGFCEFQTKFAPDGGRRVVAELDCLVSLAMASHNLDTPKCRPEFIDSPQAFIDFQDLRHPSMCLRSDFIPNDVQLGGDQARMTLLTGPNMAGKSTLLRMTAAGIIMAQMGCYVPASRARLSSVDRIQTRMGAYDSQLFPIEDDGQ